MHSMGRAGLVKPIDPGKTCLTCTSGEGSLCAPLSEQEVRTIRAYRSDVRTVPAGGHLYRQSDKPGALFSIVDGWVMLYQVMEDGQRQILDFALPGEFISFQPVTGVEVPHAVQSLTDVAACVFLQGSFERLLREHPNLGAAMIWLSARCEARAFEHLCNVSRRPARARLMHLVLELFYRVNMRLPRTGEDAFFMPLTQRHLADALGLSVEHVNRTVRELRQNGLMEIRNREVVLLDVAGCLKEGGIDPNAYLPNSFSARRTGAGAG